MVLSRLLVVPVLLSTLASASAFEQRELRGAGLPPITKDYPARIAAWGRSFFASPSALAGARISSPTLTRDGTGRLVWLVCLEAPSAGPDPRTGGLQRHAFGFAPGYFSAPIERRRATLTRDYCDELPLAYRPLQETRAIVRRR